MNRADAMDYMGDWMDRVFEAELAVDDYHEPTFPDRYWEPGSEEGARMLPEEEWMDDEELPFM